MNINLEHVQGRAEEYADDYAEYEYEYEDGTDEGTKRRKRRKRQAPTAGRFLFPMVKDKIRSFLSWDITKSCQTYLKFLGGHQEHVEDGEESVQLLCCSFQKYLHCSESVVNTTCGYETARFTKSFLDRMSGPLIQVTKLYVLPSSESNYSEPYFISTLI